MVEKAPTDESIERMRDEIDKEFQQKIINLQVSLPLSLIRFLMITYLLATETSQKVEGDDSSLGDIPRDVEKVVPCSPSGLIESLDCLIRRGLIRRRDQICDYVRY